ncbi:MAG: ABC transporter substrate-binding protein [Bacillota bacterium]
MKKLKLLTGILLIGALLLTAGTGVEALELKDGEILIDDQGNEIDITDVETVISLNPAITESLYMIDQFDNLVGVATSERSANWPEEVDELNNVGTIRNINIEKIVDIDPDLILGAAMSEEGLDKAEELGYKTAFVSPDNVDDILNNMLIYGEILGDLESAEKEVDRLETKIEEATEKSPEKDRKTAAIFSTVDPPKVFGQDSVADQVVNFAGLENAFPHDNDSSLTISFEELLVEDPDYIILVMADKEDIESDSNWQELTAVREGNIIEPATEHILRLGPRVIEGITILNEKVY